MKNVLILLIPFFLIACNNSESIDSSYFLADIEDQEEIYEISEEKHKPTPPETKQTNGTKKRIIKDGNIEIEVNELEKTKQSIDSILSKYSGYYANEKLNNSDWSASYTLNIRIPSRYFEALILDLEKGNGKIISKEIDARDVTAQFIDLETRLENKKKYLKTYTNLLKQAKTVKDILEIQERVREIEEEIESKVGRLKYLNDLVAYSTLHIDIFTRKAPKLAQPITFIAKTKDALKSGWQAIINVVLFIINVWPFWILMFIVFILWKRRKRKPRVN